MLCVYIILLSIYCVEPLNCARKRTKRAYDGVVDGGT